MQGPRRGLIAPRGSCVRRHRAVAAALAALVALVAAPPAGAQDPPEVPAGAYLLVDGRDGDVLAARAADRQASIASTTKLMTAYVARRSLELDREVVAPPYRAASAESLLGLRTGERIAVRDLLYGLLLASGNDAAVALANASAGSVPRFVERMNRAAGRLGLEDTSYANPIGLDQAGNFSTARDLVELTLELREDRFLRRLFDTARYQTRSGAETRTVTNRNTLVATVPWIDGVKTGYTLSAGYVLVGSGEQRGVDVVAAVLGAPSEAARDEATLALLDYGISLYERRRALAEGERLAETPVRDQGFDLPLEAAREVHVTAREEEEVETDLRFPPEVEGPIDRGERVGRALVLVDGERVAAVPLLAAEAVDAASPVERFDAAVPGPRALAWAIVIMLAAALVIGALAVVERGRRRPAATSRSRGGPGGGSRGIP